MKAKLVFLLILLMMIPAVLADTSTLGFKYPTKTASAYPAVFNYTIYAENMTNTSYVITNLSYSRTDLFITNVFKNSSQVNTITSSVTNASSTQSFIVVNATNTTQLLNVGSTLTALYDIQWQYLNTTSANTDTVMLDPSYTQWYGNASTINTGYHTFAYRNNGAIVGVIPSGFVPLDVWMTGAYTLTLSITDSSTGAPIPSAAVTDSNGQSFTTGANGTGAFSEPFGPVVIYVSATGYYPESMSYVIDSDQSQAIQLTVQPATPTQNTNTIWTPHQVVFQFIDANSNPIIGGYSSAQAINSTLPGGLAGGLSFFETAYGVSPSVASVMLSNVLTMNATTDDSGSIVFMLVPTIEYNINITDSTGAVFTKTLFPLDIYYQIKTTTSPFISQADLALSNQNIYNGASIFVANFTEPDKYNGTMQNFIYDATGHTAGANCWFTCVDNGTTWWDNQSWAYGAGPKVISKTVPIIPYQQWKFGCATI